MESIFVVTAVIGFMEMVKAIGEADWKAVAMILGSAVIGALAGFFGVDSLNVATGIQAGLAASGTYRVGRIVGGRE